jgi:hypothetical protein
MTIAASSPFALRKLRCGRNARPGSQVFTFSTRSSVFFIFSYTPHTLLRRNNFRRQPACPKPIHPNSKGLEQWKQMETTSPKTKFSLTGPRHAKH